MFLRSLPDVGESSQALAHKASPLAGVDRRESKAVVSRVVASSLGRFRKVAGPETPFLDRWLFECPGCGQWAYLDNDQWHGDVSVDHTTDGCSGGYHETHVYFAVLEAACNDPDATVTP